MAEVLSTKIFTFYKQIEVPQNLMTFRDAAIFTDKKILICDKQGITGKKVEYFAIPYSKIVTYSIETAGNFDLDAEIKLTLPGGVNIEFQFIKDRNMDELLFKVFNTIDNYVAR